MTFGSRLTQARKKKGLTQEGLGKGLATAGEDASKSVVYGWEKDQHYPRVDQLKLICEKLECSADFLLFGMESAVALHPDVASFAQELNAMPVKERDFIIRLVRETTMRAPKHSSGEEARLTHADAEASGGKEPPRKASR